MEEYHANHAVLTGVLANRPELMETEVGMPYTVLEIHHDQWEDRQQKGLGAPRDVTVRVYVTAFQAEVVVDCHSAGEVLNVDGHLAIVGGVLCVLARHVRLVPGSVGRSRQQRDHRSVPECPAHPTGLHCCHLDTHMACCDCGATGSPGGRVVMPEVPVAGTCNRASAPEGIPV